MRAILWIAAIHIIGLHAEISVAAGAAEAGGPVIVSVAGSTVRLPVVPGSGLRFSHISTANGLSQTRVAEILQDDEGFMWFGTQYGVNRFDGYEFKLYVHDPRNPDSPSGAYPYALFKDRSGMLWIGCNQMLDRFDPRSEHFTHYRIEEPLGSALAGTVVHISQDRAGKLWLATGSGLHRLDPNTAVIEHFHHDPRNPWSLSTNDVKWSGEDREGRFWVGTADGLDEFDRAMGRVRRHIVLPDPVQISFYEDRAGTFWIVHASGTGLAVFDPTSNAVTPYSFYDKDPSADALTGVMGVVEDPAGHLWLGSPGLGLLQLDRTNRRVIWYRNHPEDSRSIGEDKVITLFLDSEGDIWTGLHSAGLAHFSDKALPFERFVHDADDPNSLSRNFVNTIFQSRDGTLWIGNDDGINRIDRASGKRSVLEVGFSRNPMVISIGEDREGWMWFGTFSDGLRRWDPRSGHYRAYRHDASDPASLSNNEVHRIFVDHTGTVWFATDDGLDRFDPASDSFRTFKPEPQSRLSQSYVRIAEDSKGVLWLGTAQTGLHRFVPSSGEFTVYRANSRDPQGLRDDTVPAVLIDKSDIVWAGTQSGLTRLDPRTGRFRSYDTRDGLPGNAIACIRADARGRLWISTNHGISRFDPNTGTFANYAESDGLPGDDFTGWSTCMAGSDGELFFGGFAGAVGFYPDKLIEPNDRPPVVLTGLEIAGRPERVSTDGALQQSISYSSAITLTHQQKEFSISFAGLRYLSPSSNRYRYRLLGLDAQWREVDSGNRRATYMALPAGSYEFQAQAASGHGSWNEPGASIRIRILPAWWATWWFRGLYISLAVFVLWAAYRIRIAQLARRMALRMEERVNERTRIAQDLHDTLLQGLLSASLQLAVANGHVPTESQAKPLVDRVLALLRALTRESRNIVTGLRTLDNQKDSLEVEIGRVPLELDPMSHIQFKLLVEGEARRLRSAVRSEVYWIAREALANGFRHSRATRIEALIEYGVGQLRVVIRDNGTGFDLEVLRRQQGRHWGLSGLSERAQRIEADLEVSSAPGAGTEVDLIVPANSAYADSPRSKRAGRWFLLER